MVGNANNSERNVNKLVGNVQITIQLPKKCKQPSNLENLCKQMVNKKCDKWSLRDWKSRFLAHFGRFLLGGGGLLILSLLTRLVTRLSDSHPKFSGYNKLHLFQPSNFGSSIITRPDLWSALISFMSTHKDPVWNGTHG